MILAMTLAQALQQLAPGASPAKIEEIDAYNRGYADGLIFASMDVQINSSLVPVELQPFYAVGVNDRREGKAQRTNTAQEPQTSIVPAVVGAIAGILGFVLVLKASKRK